MNQKTTKLLANYAKESGRTRKDIKNWWRSLIEEDKDRARRNITAFVENARKDKRAESIRKRNEAERG